MKIKVSPEDFVVDEILDVPIQKKGEYSLYRLQKRHENTVNVLHEIAKESLLPFSAFSFGGRKDKHALTRQHITINNNRALAPIKKKNYSFDFLGFLSKPMTPQFIKTNRFMIVIRDLTEEEIGQAQKGIADVQQYGFPNYFDDQRFGTFDIPLGFLAEKILKKHFNGALKIYLTHISSEDNKETKKRKNSFLENWGHWSLCLEKAQESFEEAAFSHLIKKPKDFVFLLQRIPYEELSLFYSAYQAALWNEVLKEVVKFKAKKLQAPIRGLVEDYLFYSSPDPTEDSFLKKLTIPTCASNIKWYNLEIKNIYAQILQEHELKLPMFNITKIRQAYFKTTERNAVVIPKNTRVQTSDDDIYTGRQKLTLNFTLPRGSYATMLIKRIFSN